MVTGNFFLKRTNRDKTNPRSLRVQVPGGGYQSLNTSNYKIPKGYAQQKTRPHSNCQQETASLI